MQRKGLLRLLGGRGVGDLWRRCTGGASLPRNEPLSRLEKGSTLRTSLAEAIERLKRQPARIPAVVDGREIHNTEKNGVLDVFMPSDTSTRLAWCTLAEASLIAAAVDGALAAKTHWERLSHRDRAHIFSKASHLLRTKYRAEMLAATILGQAKTPYQADIDCICELVDFLEFNVHYAEALSGGGPSLLQSDGVCNSLRLRPLEGFVAAIAPFNFTAIGGNLCTAPALMGNVVLWKPSLEAVLSSHLFYRILLEAGLPSGVIQFLPSEGETFGKVVTAHTALAAINFTGSTSTFDQLWSDIGRNISRYRSYPRLVGETGGKNFHLLHESADIDVAVNATIRSAFEYSGQKCSACSNVYVPDTLWEKFRDTLVSRMKLIRVGQPDDFESFLSAVIRKKSWDRIRRYIDSARASPRAMEIIHGGECSDSQGYFVHPTVIRVHDRQQSIMTEEIFGPVLCVHVYKPQQWTDIITHIDTSNAYALTGAIFARDRKALILAEDLLRNATGNLYINDKSTGAVVGQQPFGGARKSGTNDKAGMASYLLRFVSPQSRKESYHHSCDLLHSFFFFPSFSHV